MERVIYNCSAMTVTPQQRTREQARRYEGELDARKRACPVRWRGKALSSLDDMLIPLSFKWQRTCAYCHAREVPLEIEHIVPKSRGGCNRTSNLTLACHSCNERKGTQTAAEFGFPAIQAQARKPLKDAAHMSAMKTRVIEQLRIIFGNALVSVTYGYETKYKRIQILTLPKSHANDAVAIACEMGEVVKPYPVVHQLRCVSCGNYQLYNGTHSEHNVWAPHKVKGWKLYERVAAKGQVGYIGGRRLKGAFLLKDLRSGKTILEVVPSKLQRIARCTRGWMVSTIAFNEREDGASSLG